MKHFLMFSIPSPRLGVRRAILIILECDAVFIMLLLSTLITRLLIVFKEETYSIVSLSSLERSVKRPDCKKQDVIK
mgnify:CR=1 FL=1